MALIPEKLQKEIYKDLVNNGIFNNLFIQKEKEMFLEIEDTKGKKTKINAEVTWTNTGEWFSWSNNKTISDFKPERIVFNEKTTVLFWKDKSKTIVTCGENDVYDSEHGVAMAIAHKMFGSKNQFKKFVKNNSHTEVSKEEKLKRKEEQKNKKSAKLQHDS